MQRLTLAGVRFSAGTMRDCVSLVREGLAAQRRCIIAFANAEFVIEARGDAELRGYLNGCDAVFADGISVVLMSRCRGGPRLPERVTGTDFVPELCRLSAERGVKLCFVGGKPGVGEVAADRLRRLHPGVQIVGVFDGFNDLRRGDALVDDINGVGADVLMVCLGNPLQERWIAANAERLTATVLFGNGGALDFWSGMRRRAPRWVRACGLEWLFRLVQEPTWARLRRQMRLPLFPVYVCLDILSGIRERSE